MSVCKHIGKDGICVLHSEPFYKEPCHEGPCNDYETMNDLISRKAAIDTIEFGITYAKAINKETGEVTPMFERENKALEDAVERIRQLPTIDPVNHGKWIWQDSPVFGNPYGSYMCPLCQNTMPHKTNYCPNCGARMDGGEE